MRKKKKQNTSRVIAYIVGIVIGICILIAAWQPRLSLPTIFEVGNASGLVDISMTPQAAEIDLRTDQVLTLTATSLATASATKAHMEIAYDNTKLRIDGISLGSYLSGIVVAPVITDNKITFTLSKLDSDLATGSGTLATIKIHPLTNGTSTVMVTENAYVHIGDDSTNSLRTVTGSTITVKADQVSPTPNTVVSKTTSLRIERATCNTLTFSWDKLDGAKGYVIDLADNSNFDNKKSSGTLGNDRDNYNFTDLKNGTQYYARVTQTDIHDFPRHTQLGPVNTLGSCVGASVTTTTSIAKTTAKPKASVKASPRPSPSTIASPTPQGSLEPSGYTDKRFDNVGLETTTDADDPRQSSLFARFIAWLASLFQ